MIAESVFQSIDSTLSILLFLNLIGTIALCVVAARLGQARNNAREIRKLAELCEQHLRAMKPAEQKHLPPETSPAATLPDPPPPIPPKAVAPEFHREQHGDTVTYR